MNEPKPIARNIIESRDPNPPLGHEFSRSDYPTIEKTLLSIQQDKYIAEARKQPGSRQLSDEEIKAFAKQTLDEMFILEQAARSPNIWDISPEVAQLISLIVDYSAPGTYYRPVKNDRWQDESFAWGLDRMRADIAARLGIHIAGLKTGRDLSSFAKMGLLDNTDPTLNALQPQARQSITNANLHFYYVGRPDEGQDIIKVINTPSSFVPKENVTVINTPDVDNAIDQTRKLGEYLHAQGDKNMVLVCQVPQIPRIMSIINHQKIIPDGVRVYVFLIPTPTLGLKDNTIGEVRRKLNTYITHRGEAQSFPYIILGGKVDQP